MTKPLRLTIKYLAFLLCLWLMGSALLCSAAENTLTVRLADGEKNPLSGIVVELCRVTDQDRALTEAFSDAGISLSALAEPSSVHAEQLTLYHRQKGIDVLTAAAENGSAVFTGLEQGLWLVSCREGQSHSFCPFLVQISEGPAAVSPKTETIRPGERTLYLVKKWEDGQNAGGTRPDSITVTLKKDGEPFQQVTLTQETGWSHTFSGLPESGVYTVEESPVEHYTAAYSGDAENGLIITNTYQPALPQTGLLRWPILILTVAGLCLIILGILQFTGKKTNEKNR